MRPDQDLEYTQTQVAFPGVPMRGGVTTVDELHIGCVQTGEEFRIAFIELPPYGVVAHLDVFGDGLDALCDSRIQNVIGRWRDAESAKHNATSGDFVRWLEAEGVRPSRYQRAGIERLQAAEPKVTRA